MCEKANWLDSMTLEEKQLYLHCGRRESSVIPSLTSEAALAWQFLNFSMYYKYIIAKLIGSTVRKPYR